MVTRTKKIFVGGLSAPTTLEDVKNYFEQFGQVSWKSFDLNFEIIFNFLSPYNLHNLSSPGTFLLNVHVNLPILHHYFHFPLIFFVIEMGFSNWDFLFNIMSKHPELSNR